jgi:hypothetical protein
MLTTSRVLVLPFFHEDGGNIFLRIIDGHGITKNILVVVFITYMFQLWYETRELNNVE